jgi:hypothetical protein
MATLEECSEFHRCWDKRCAICSDFKAKHIKSTIVNYLQPNAYCYYMTLTKKLNDKPLRKQIKILFKDFHKLRNRKIWRKHVLGGVWSLQLVGDDHPDRWLPHVHAMVSAMSPEGGSFERMPWKAQWKQITSDSDQVKVDPVTNLETEPWHMSNYIVKRPQILFEQDQQMMAEFFSETKHVRFVGTMGSWRGMPLRAKKPPPADMDGGNTW